MWHQVPNERDGGKPLDADPHKVGKLIRLLSSPVDGEVIGAVRARRVLAGFGGFHHLADLIEVHWHPPIVVAPEPTKPDWQVMAAELLEHPELLIVSARINEVDFLANMRRSRVPPTDRQRKWMGDIAARREQRRAS
jgi:hypothetical protein